MKNMFITAFIFLILLSCNDAKVEKKENKKNVKSNVTEKKDKIESGAPEQLSTLFYKYVPVKNDTGEKKQNVIVKTAVPDYRVIIDWMVSNKRYVKLKNMATGVEYVVMEGDTGSNIKLIQRTLFYYKFNINGQIIEVKR
jgi:hypothetical protein